MGRKDPVVVSKEKTVRMRFPKDQYYNDLTVPLYKGGEVVDVPERMVVRWLKRGGVLITDEVAGRAPMAPSKPPEKLETQPADEGDEKSLETDEE